MGRFAVLIVLLGLGRLSAQTRVSVAQLEDFLSSRQATKESDAEIAHQLGGVQLQEQLTDLRFARLRARIHPGPHTEEQLGLLALISVFEAPPSSDLPPDPTPDAATQQQIIETARARAVVVVHQLPDFMATRTTQLFNSMPRSAGTAPSKPQIELHFIGERHRQVTVRSGHEVAAPSEADPPPPADSEGLTTWGEFGPILATIFGDSLQGNIAWSRWQNDGSEKPLAVFHYSVPKAASHDLIDLCCYLGFHDTPAYRGDLYLDPASGAVLQLTLDAELGDDLTVRESKMSVRYGPVDIGGKTYICPTRGVAVSVVHDTQLEKVDGVGLVRFVNVVHFTEYHKFGSTARILTSEE